MCCHSDEIISYLLLCICNLIIFDRWKERLELCLFFTCPGRLHYVQIFWCKCIPLSVSLVRCGFWPAVPEKPSVGFAWELLEMLRALMLECQISVQGFCRALRCKSNLMDSEVFTCSSLVSCTCTWTTRYRATKLS